MLIFIKIIHVCFESNLTNIKHDKNHSHLFVWCGIEVDSKYLLVYGESETKGCL